MTCIPCQAQLSTRDVCPTDCLFRGRSYLYDGRLFCFDQNRVLVLVGRDTVKIPRCNVTRRET